MACSRASVSRLLLVLVGAACCAVPVSGLPPEVGVARGWGDHNTSHLPPGLTNLIAIDASRGHTIGLTSDGKVFVWGSSTHNLHEVPPDLTNAVAVSAGYNSCAAVRADGTIAAWGGLSHLVPTEVTNAVAVSGPTWHHRRVLRGGRWHGAVGLPMDP
ncbi:MAG: hypothetical protein H7A46_19825 [Verrucomicrobiales bacterium]|nr:hypothetical protein [Verrucomicrobiales bacterium]